MKADKVIVEIKVEALSMDAIPGLIEDVIRHLVREHISGTMRMDDGDQVTWSTTKILVEF